MIKFRIYSLTIEISFFFIAIVTLMSAFDDSGIVMCALAAAFLHELGHVLASIVCGLRPKNISLNIFGIEMKCDNNTLSYSREIMITFAGPLFNFVFCLIFYLINLYSNSQIIATLSIANLALGIFNMLPIEALDGGRGIKLLLCLKCSPEKAEKISLILSVICMLPLFCGAFYLLFITPFNVTLLLACIYLTYLIVNRIR